MAYSDYGGYAYRNGERVVERSDATITPKGDTFGTPGSYPGFAMLAAGVPAEEVKTAMEWPTGHAILGDGPIYVVLRKQWASVFRGPEKLVTLDRDWPSDGNNEDEQRKTFEADGCKVEVVLTHEDNYYVYARITQADGNAWTGFAGYGVGAGLEDGDHGFSTAEREDMLSELFPPATQEPRHAG
jgi:hypothetical protein